MKWSVIFTGADAFLCTKTRMLKVRLLGTYSRLGPNVLSHMSGIKMNIC